MRGVWRKYSFLGADTQLSHEHKIQVIISNQISLNITFITCLLIPLFTIFNYNLIAVSTLAIPLLMAVSVPILNASGKRLASGVIICLIIPLSVVISNVFMKIFQPLEHISESDYYRSHLWLIVSLIVPFLVIDSRKKVLFYTMLSLPILMILCINKIYAIFGVSFGDAGYDPMRIVFYNIVSILVGLFVVFGLSFMINLNKYYRTKVKQMQEKLYESEKMASLGVLTSGISHEINNPLNFIKGGVEIIRKEMMDNKDLHEYPIKDSLALIDEGSDRVTKIVKSLRYFGEARVGNNELFDLQEVIRGCVDELSAETDPDIQIKLVFGIGELVINGNRQQLHHALLNVLTNAVQAIEEKGEVTIATSEHTSDNVIAVIDSGAGISPEDLPRVTDPLYTTRDPGKGIGMGLSIAYNIVKWHHGAMSISSEIGSGTKVEITFPRGSKMV